ncbi:dihydrodipicolinate reductase C-terminal domain-containing protein [Gaoshiqia sp. Z1-71]|uniref:dihydrodipicolinate reductase C-terminal domain-containing protein n=1 Tax=Gaoshiqia hydrogeniformans TaxID=3290090 RepID=UPI003BF8F3F1
MKIYLAGSGKLALAILNSGLSLPSADLLKWEPSGQTSTEKAIIVHAGSGRQLPECFEFCSRTKSALIELSTGLETEKMDADFPLIICPNTSMLVLKTLQMLKASGGYFEQNEISITESHQSAKRTAAGTAYAFADALHFPTGQIVSVRDPEIQRTKIGIPEAYLDKHACHKIVVKDGTDEVTIETRVLGHESYAGGVKKIIETVLKHPLENRTYTVLELIGNHLL